MKIKKTVLKLIRRLVSERYNLKDQFDAVEKATTMVRDAFSVSKGVSVLCPIKNGQDYIHDFIHYYRKMGIGNIVLLDNGSSDNTIEIASKIENVTILSCPLDFSTYETGIRRYLIEKYGKNSWTLSVDIDEFFDFPYSDRATLHEFIHYLEKEGHEALICQMVDAIPHEEYSLSEPSSWKFFIASIDKNDFEDYCNHLIDYYRYPKSFDGKISNKEIPFLVGGLRRAFFEWTYYPLTKIPLIYYREGIDPLVSAHFTNSAHYADISGAIYHHAFFGDYYERFNDRSKTFRKRLEGYKRLYDTLNGDNDFPLKHSIEESLAGNFERMIETGLIHSSKQYEDYLADLES